MAVYNLQLPKSLFKTSDDVPALAGSLRALGEPVDLTVLIQQAIEAGGITLPTTFAALSDTPTSPGTSNYIIGYDGLGTSVIAIDPTTLGTQTFLTLGDTINSFSGLGTQLLRVNAAETAVENVSITPLSAIVGSSTNGLLEVAPTTGGTTEQVLQFDDNTDTYSFVDVSTLTTFLTLSDTPSSYVSNQLIGANALGTALEHKPITTNSLIFGAADGGMSEVTPTLGGATTQVLQFNDTTDTYSFVTKEDKSIYTGDDSLTGTRTVSLAGSSLTFDDLGIPLLSINPTLNIVGIDGQVIITGTTTLSGYGTGIKDDTTLGKTTSGYIVGLATDGTLIDVLFPAQELTITRTDADLTVDVSQHSIIVVHTTSGRTITLPATPVTGNSFTIKQRTTDTIVSGNGTNIEGSVSYTMPLLNQSITLVYDSVEWVII